MHPIAGTSESYAPMDRRWYWRSMPRRPSLRRCRSATSPASEPRVLCHRDYHSRNLMLSDGSLYIIDFQDARLGPDTYDLVSLLRDSYVDLTDREVDELTAYFLALKHGDRSLDADEEFR